MTDQELLRAIHRVLDGVADALVEALCAPSYEQVQRWQAIKREREKLLAMGNFAMRRYFANPHEIHRKRMMAGLE